MLPSIVPSSTGEDSRGRWFSVGLSSELKVLKVQQARYEEVHTAKLSAYRKKRYSLEESPEQILRTPPPCKSRANQRGGAKDIVELFQRIYKRRGWDKYAKFNRQGGPQTPYVLFKSKKQASCPG